MKDYRISFYLEDMFHSNIVEAENEYLAILKVLLSMYERSARIFRDFKIERYYPE